MKKLLAFLIFSIFCAIPVMAEDITMTINQTEYFFLLGQQAVVPLEINNSYDKDIDGLLTYTVTQQVNQGGMQYSSSNSQSQSFVAKQGDHLVNIGFGTSNQPVTFLVGLSFGYTDKEELVVSLDDIRISFVQDPSQQQNEQNQQQSSSQSKEEQQENQLQKQVQQMQQQIDEMFQQPQTTEEKLQNNQLDQDSSALKQQMQKEMEKRQQMEQELKEALEQNEEFQEQHQQMLDQGFEQSGANLDPINSTTGDFEVNYEKEGEQASLQGSMENGEITELESSTSMNDENIMEKLQQNAEFQNFDQQLQQEGFERQTPEIQRDGNTTTVKVPYTNELNETATIKATLENNEIVDVELEQNKRKALWWLLALLPLALLGVFFYKKRSIQPEKILRQKHIDYKKESRALLEKAKQLFEQKRYKDAYGKAGEAIRFFYSHKLGIKTELTNLDLVKNLKKNKLGYANVQNCLNLCGLVEFAKYKPNDKDFDEIIDRAEKIIGQNI